MNQLARQTLAQVRKNLIIHARRHGVATIFRAFILPVIFISFVSYSRYLFVQPALYGIGSAAPVRTLSEALSNYPSKTLYFVNSGLGGDVDRVIESLQNELKGKGKVGVIEDPEQLRRTCKQSLRGVSNCFAAVVFEDFPGSGDNGRWNYTLRADSSLSFGNFNAEKHKNDVQEILMPIQYSVDQAIARVSNRDAPSIEVEEYMYTSKNKKEYEEYLRHRYSSAIVNYISVVLLIGMIGIVYHLTGWQALERERGLSTLVEAMGGSKTSRMLSYILSFAFFYIGGWVVMALNLWGGIFRNSSIAVVLIWHLLSGYSLAGWALFVGSIFKKAQLSGISATVGSLVLGIIAQVSKDLGTGGQAILSLLFPPMNYVFFSITLGRAEGQGVAASVIRSPASGNSKLPLLAQFIFFAVQAVVFPFLAALLERYFYGTASPGHRHLNVSSTNVANAVELRGYSKTFYPRLLTKWFGSHKEPVLAVNNLDLSVLRGQIMVLLGANGSGKTTTLEAIAGLAAVQEGNIYLNVSEGASGIGICPQKNVLWDDMTVLEHVKIWNWIKCQGNPDGLHDIKKLIADCDLMPKRNTKSKNLSGGQKRKLQLAAMFTGGSSICAIDEVSSGLDPLSRRKIWDIVLAARGTRTILMTSHYLDEADLLADHIAILSKGKLKCEGSAVELKTSLGGGYRVHAPIDAPQFDGVVTKRFYDQTIYNVKDSAAASRLIEGLEKSQVTNYYVQGPTIEDVFLKVAEETVATRSENTGRTVAEKSSDSISVVNSGTEEKKAVNLYDGQELPWYKQTWVLIRKRITILQRGYLPLITAIVVPILAAGITMVVFKNYPGVSCSLDKQSHRASSDSLASWLKELHVQFLSGPRDEVLPKIGGLVGSLLPGNASSGSQNPKLPDMADAFKFVDSLGKFNDYIEDNYKNVTPGGVFLESDRKATLAFQYDILQLISGITMQNVADNLLLGVPDGIATQFLQFDIMWPAGQGTTLLFVTYTGLAFACFPALFILYPTFERLRNVRALHYSNGVRAFPLWLAYTIFDFVPSILICSVCAIIWAAATSGWYGLGYLYLVLLLYSLTAILLCYCVSLIARSQLSAFAFAAGGQAAMFLIYFIIYMSVFTYSSAEDQDRNLELTHYVVATVSPIASLMHSFFVSLNSFSIDCNDEVLESYPATFKLYGSPILYLFVQSILLFSILVLHDSGKLSFRLPSFRRSKAPANTTIPPRENDEEDTNFEEKEISHELVRVTSACADPLRLEHISKTFKKTPAVEDVTFGVPRSEVFALLGPNGAGKTTTINMIRGDLRPTSGSIFVQNITVTRGRDRASARAHLGVCPQFDAMDRLSTEEHLIFYARVRGVKDIRHNVDEVINAVGLEEFRYRSAEQLSGGNKRKLSLAIALMGNPSVLLLDEPSSGMDAASKRVMWRTLEAVSSGRATVLTTHSMEECSALAQRAGILAKRMLALGTTEELRRRYGNKYLVHLVLASAPHSTADEMTVLRDWVEQAFPGVEIEQRTFGGQLRFSVPAGEERSVERVFAKLEREARGKGAAFWSVDRGTMDMVFLEVVGRAGVKEEGSDEEKRNATWWVKRISIILFCPWMLLIR